MLQIKDNKKKLESPAVSADNNDNIEYVKNRAISKLAEYWHKDVEDFENTYVPKIGELAKSWQSGEVLDNYNNEMGARLQQIRENQKYANQATMYIDDFNEREKVLKNLNVSMNYLSDRQKQISSLKDYWSQWDSEDSYKKSPAYYFNNYNSSLPDWNEYVEKGKNADDSGFLDFIGIGGDTEHYLINFFASGKKPGDTFRSSSALNDGVFTFGDKDNIKYAYMSDDEVARYNYLYGKEGADSASKYLDSLSKELATRTSKIAQEEAMQLAEKHPVLSSALSVLFTAKAPEEYAENLANKISGNESDDMSYHYSDIKNNLRGAVSKDMSATGSFLYNTGMSMVDTLIRLPAGSVGLVFASADAANSTSSEILKRGGNDAQALIGGTLAGIWEGLFEKMSLGSLNAMKSAPATTVKNFIFNILKQGGSEASEEALTEIANALTDYIVMGDLSNWNIGYQQYINEGYTESEAWKKVVLDTAKDVGLSALGGFISGSVMSPGAQALGLHEAYKTGSQIENISNIDDLANYAIKNFDQNTDAYKIAEQYKNNSADVSKTVIAPILENAINETINEKVRYNKKGNKSKNPFLQKDFNLNVETRIGASDMLNKAYYDIPTQTESLLEQSPNESVKQNTGTASIMLELTSNGMPEAEASRQADILYRISTGKNVSANELHEVSKVENIPARQVIQRMTGITLPKSNSESRAAVKKYLAEIAATKNESAKSNEKAAGENIPAQQIGTTEEQQTSKKEAPNRAIPIQNLDVAGKAKYELIAEKYTGQLSREYFDHSFNALYNAAKSGIPYKGLSNIGNMLNDYERKSIYDAGKADRKIVEKKIQSVNEEIKKESKADTHSKDKPINETSTTNKMNAKGSVKREYSKETKISEQTKNQIDVIERVAEATGINFVIFESKTDDNGNFIDENGRYDTDSNTVYIEVHAGLKNASESMHTALVNTASHELTHFIRKWSSAQYVKLQEFLVDEFGVDFTDGRIKEITEMYARKGIELTYEQAMEELVSNSCNNMLLNSKAIIKLARQNMTLAQKIKSWIDEWTEKVKAAFSGDRRMPKETIELLQKSKETLQKVQAIWDHALVEATKNYNENIGMSTNHDEKFSIRYTTDNKPVAVIDEDVLKDVSKENWIKTVKAIIKERFNNGIPINGRLIKVNIQSRNEFTMSKDTQKLRSKKPDIYKDKFRSSGRLDEIVLASTNYINEDLNHTRNDNFKEFARGNVLLKIGENDYSANVVIGFTSGNQMVLYDVINFEPTSFKLKKTDAKFAAQSQEITKNSSNASVNDSTLSQNDDAVNTQYAQKAKEDTSELNGDNVVDISNNKKYNEKGDYYGREKTDGEFENTEAGRNGRVSGQTQPKSDLELEKKVSTLDRRKNYRGIERSLKSKLEAQNVTPVDLYYNTDAAKFANSIQFAKEKNLHGAYVTQYSINEYKNMSLFLSDDGNVGVALHDTEYGTDIVSVFKNPDVKVKKAVSSILLTSIENGGNKLDNFDGKLSEMYAQHGFIPVARCAFNEEFAPSDWNYERDGKPDIIFWIHDGNNVDTIVDHLSDRVLIDVDKIPLFDDYDAAGDYRDGLIASLGKNISEESIYEAIREIPITKENSSYDKSTRFQLREEMERSDRELLADALFTITTNQKEQDRLEAYKRAIKNLDELQNKLADINMQLKELSFAKGERNVEKINNLKAQKNAISRKLDWWDKRLIGLESEQPIRDLIARERNKSLDKFKKEIAKAKAEDKQILSQKLLEQKAEYEARIKWNRDRRHDTEDRRKQREYIKKQVKKMNSLLIHETDMKHIPQALKKPVADFLSIFTEDDTGVFDYKKLDLLKSAYEKIGAGEYDNNALSIYFDNDISSELDNLKNTIDGRRLSELTIDELHSVKNIVDHFKYIIKTENELFVNGKKVDYEKYGKRAMQELSSKGPKYNNALVAKSKTMTEFKKLIANKNITPIYFFKNIGGEIQELFKNIENGQYVYAKNIYASSEFFKKTAKYFHVKDWVDVKNDTIEFTSDQGKKINLSRQQALSVYALSKRKQGLLHLKGGGIVIENDLKAEKEKGKIIGYTYKQNDAVQLTDADLARINSWLTKEQKAFADEMVRYLSQDMALLGNEVSMALYGYEKYGEDYYFPIISSDNYKYSKQGNVIDPRLKSQSFTKQTVENANNPVVAKDFIEVWGDHVNRMELYNALAVPLETFNRIYNYKDVVVEGQNAKSIKALLMNAYGEEAIRYIDNLMKDINGGIRGDGAESWQNSWVSKFKKNAVFASLSVLIQQPSAIGRAMALVDPKYFVASAFDQVKQKNTYAELKQYAPVAIIKEMGRFDTGTGASTVNWLTSFTYDSITEKSTAFFKDSDYRDEILSKGPNKADEITWCHIWEAIKRETADKTGLSITSEVLLQKAGERFTEVINLTQVYDSVFSRSELMRSKSGMVKMLTAFMAEPTLSYNMLYDAGKQAKNGGKAGKVYLARAASAYTFSVVLNSILKSLVTAARDDDDDKTYSEKYVGAFVENILSDLNPLSLIPWVKDAVSIFKGYSVERADMSLISDLYEATTNLDSESISAWEKQERFIGAIAALFGVPYRNISRDIRSLRNVIVDWTDDLETTKSGLKYSVMDSINDSSWLASSIFDLDTGSNADKLYHAIVEEDEAAIEKYESIIGKDKLESNIRKGLKNNSELVMEAALLAIDRRFVDYSDVFDQIEAQGFEHDDIISAINSIENMIGKAAKAKQDGDDEEYKKAIDALRDIDMPESDIKRAIEKYPVSTIEESAMAETYESIYSGKQLAYAVEDGNVEDIKTIIDDLTKEHDEKLRAKGKTESEIKQGIASYLRSSLTSYFKPLYQECYQNKDYNGMQEIRDKLNALRSYGIKYRGDDYSDWIKELAKKNK